MKGRNVNETNEFISLRWQIRLFHQTFDLFPEIRGIQELQDLFSIFHYQLGYSEAPFCRTGEKSNERNLAKFLPGENFPIQFCHCDKSRKQKSSR